MTRRPPPVVYPAMRAPATGEPTADGQGLPAPSADPDRGGEEPRRTPKTELRQIPWRVLTRRNFGLYFAGSTVSNFGTWLQNTAQALLAYHLTHSALVVGVIVCAQFSPVLLLGPWVGTFLARTGPGVSRLLVMTQLGSAAVAGTLAGLYATGHLTVVYLGAGALLLGVAYCFALPAFTVLVPTLVPDGETRAAMAMNSVSYNLGRAIAPLCAVLIVVTVGSGWVFALNGASFLVLATVLYALRSRRAGHHSSLGKIKDEVQQRARVRRAWPLLAMVAAVAVVVARTLGEMVTKLRTQPGPHTPRSAGFIDGFRIVRRDRSLWLLVAMVAAVTFAADPVLVLGPAMAQHVGVSGNRAGYFLAALGAGTVAASFLPVRSPRRLRAAAYPLFFLGLTIVVFALGLHLWLCVIMAFMAGGACLLTGAVTQTLLLRLAGPSRVAMVMAVWAVAWAGSKPVASLTDGLLANWLGIQYAGILMAAPALLPGLIICILPERMWLRSSPEAPVTAPAH
jgi:predicted MFS family arabinose efflux permease